VHEAEAERLSALIAIEWMGRAFLADRGWGWGAAGALGEKVDAAPQLVRSVTTMELWV